MPVQFARSANPQIAKYCDVTVQRDAASFLRRMLELGDSAGRYRSTARTALLRDVAKRPAAKGSAGAAGAPAGTSQDTSWVMDVFSMQQHSTVCCGSCGAESRTSASDLSLELELNQPSRLVDCVDSYFQEERLDGYRCSRCVQEKVPEADWGSTKTLRMADPPAILRMGVKRFAPGHAGEVKTHHSVYIPDVLDVSRYCEGRGRAQYRLCAICHHHGKCAQSGHYVAECRSVADGSWRRFDDSVVTKIDCPAGPSETAYILFYERV